MNDPTYKLSRLEIIDDQNSPLDHVDPEWDYYSVLEELLKLQNEVGITIAFIKDQENATVPSHAQLAMRLQRIASILQIIEEKLQST